MTAERGAMFGEFVSAGGFGEGVGVIREARFNQWDYNGSLPQPILALRLKIADAQGNDHVEQLSSGELRFFQPSIDGKRAVPVTQQDKLNINTNAVAFIISLMNADTRGQFAAKLRATDDISILEGLTLYLITKEVKRAGLVSNVVAGQQAKAQTQLLVQQVLGYPGEAVSGAAGAPAATPVAAPAAATTGAVAAGPAVAASAAPAGNGAVTAAAAIPGGVDPMQAAIVLKEVVDLSGGKLMKTQIAGKVFSSPSGKAMAVPERNAILGVVTRDDFLGSDAVTMMGMVYDRAAGTIANA